MNEQLTDIERREWQKVFNTKWYQQVLPGKVKELVKTHPPFYIYDLKGTGHIATIHSYHDSKEDPDAVEPFMTVMLLPKYNREFLVERGIWGVPPRALERIELRCIADAEQIVSTVSNGLPWMQRLINTRDRNDVLRGNSQIPIDPKTGG